jgi:hypothetical protein
MHDRYGKQPYSGIGTVRIIGAQKEMENPVPKEFQHKYKQSL